jgi:hypothetical protein
MIENKVGGIIHSAPLRRESNLRGDGKNISKLEKVCAKSLKKEFMLREAYKERHSKKGKEAKLGIRIAIKEVESNAGHYTHKTDISYILPDKKKVVDMHGVKSSQTFDISNRMLVSMVKRFQKSVLDSILKAEGYEGTSNFKFVKSKRCFAEPAFSVSGGMFKRIHVIYSSNPLSYETVSFDIDVPTKHVASMACQLAGSVLLMFILAFCLWYQMKTIMILKTPTNIPLYWSVVDLLSQDRLSFQPKPFMLFLKTGTRQ